MNKKELLKLPKLYATLKMKAMVDEDKPKEKWIHPTFSQSYTVTIYDHYQYYRATTSQGILKLAIFERKYIAAGEKEPEFEIYISKEEEKYLTYEPRTGKWKTAKIDNLDYNRDTGYYHGNNKPWYSGDTKRIVNEYLETGMLEVKDAVLKYQNGILEERTRKKNRSELEAIDAVMNAVPELPKDFDNWVMKSAFSREQYIFYHYGKKNGYCTHCEQEVTLKEKPLHNAEGKCPVCGSRVTLKAWKKQKYITNEKRVGIIQKLTDGTGYILRKFKCRLIRTREKDWKLDFSGCWEKWRFRLDEQFANKEFFEWGEYKKTHIERWCHQLNHGFNYGWGYAVEDDDCVLYHRNIKKIRKEAGAEYMPVEELLRKKQGCYCHAARTMERLLKQPKAEYLIKAGLYKLTWQIFDENHEEILKWNAKKTWDVLGVTKEQMEQCIRLDISYRELQVLKCVNEYGIRMTDAQIRYFTKIVGPRLIGRLAVYGHLGKFESYFGKEFKNKANRIGDYFDYLNDLKTLKIPITKKELFPKNFQAVHQELTLQRQEKEDRLQKMKIQEKDRLLRAMLQELEEIYHGENKEFIIVLPTCKEDFNREGRENHNCVGGTYFDKMLKGDCVVLFLRKKEEPEKAFCTVEMNGSEIVQCREIFNRPAPEEAMKFMEKFSKDVKKRLREKQAQIAI